MLAMASRDVAVIGRSGAEILQNMHADSTGPAAFVTVFFNALNKFAQVAPLAQTDFAQRIPDFRFKAHAGSAGRRIDVPVYKSAADHTDAPPQLAMTSPICPKIAGL